MTQKEDPWGQIPRGSNTQRLKYLEAKIPRGSKLKVKYPEGNLEGAPEKNYLFFFFLEDLF